MLRIREYNKITGEKIELEELEKFGFINTKNDTWYKNEPNDAHEVFETNIVINPVGGCFKKNEIIFEVIDLDNSEEKSDIDIGARVDTIYDLTVAGYVEKVEEE